MNFRPVARNSNLLVQKLDREVVVYDLKTNHALYLNETSAMIWFRFTNNSTCCYRLRGDLRYAEKRRNL